MAFVLGICNNRILAKGKKKRILKFVTMYNWYCDIITPGKYSISLTGKTKGKSEVGSKEMLSMLLMVYGAAGAIISQYLLQRKLRNALHFDRYGIKI